jgi:hypothetical protein
MLRSEVKVVIIDERGCNLLVIVPKRRVKNEQPTRMHEFRCGEDGAYFYIL